MDRAAEDSLLARCRTGSEAAFAELVDHHKQFVFGVIVHDVGDVARAEDLTQEVFLRVYRSLRHFRGESRLTTWLFRIARNVCIEHARRAPAPIALDDVPPHRLPGQPDSRFREIELRDTIAKAMAKLPEQERLLISAYYFGGRKYEDLASDFDLPLGTVKVQLHRAKQRLRELL